MDEYILTFDVKAKDFERAGEVSTNIRKILKQLSIDPEAVKKAAVACYEAEMNIVIHSYGGKIKLEVNFDRIRIIAQDNGPGIENIDLAMEEGYSTATEEIRELGFGAGMGLPNIKKNTDFFDITSQKGTGTIIVMEILF